MQHSMLAAEARHVPHVTNARLLSWLGMSIKATGQAHSHSASTICSTIYSATYNIPQYSLALLCNRYLHKALEGSQSATLNDLTHNLDGAIADSSIIIMFACNRQ